MKTKKAALEMTTSQIVFWSVLLIGLIFLIVLISKTNGQSESVLDTIRNMFSGGFS